MIENTVFRYDMEKIAKIFDLELGEKFMLFSKDGEYEGEYRFEDYGLEGFFHDEKEVYYKTIKVLRGDYIIKKYPWKPKEGEIVYIVEFDCFSESFKPKKFKYCNNLYFQMLYRLGLIFKTEKEAEENIHLTMQLMGCNDFIEWGNKNEKRLED